MIVDGPLLEKPFSCDCGNSKFFSLITKKMIDVQKIVLEEPQDNLGSGKQARKIDIYLSGDLVDPTFQRSIIPGNRVKLSGVLLDKPLRIERGRETARREIFLECNYIENTEQDFDELEISDDDIIEIKKIASNPKIYNNLVKSIAPSIFGYEKEKLSIGLQLFSGVQKIRADGMKSRGDIHILLVGDPGAAKSQMLKYVCDLSPKGRYAVGKSTSGAGLTASCIKDEFTGSWTLEAGALVLANGGLLALDEMDKMGKDDRSSIHEAMEQQTITVNKASIQATLNAKTIILAAANPKYGRFDPFQSIPEQINLPDTLISRFDLIFPIRDIPDKTKDKNISGHILSLHKNPTKQDPPITQKMIRKYISYARNHCNPELTDAAINKIQNFYVKLRNQKSDKENPPVPLTARQLEALVRLSEASARVRLSKTVDTSDAERAIDLLKYCLSKVGVDPETGIMDIDVMTSGVSKKKRNVLILVSNKISELCKKSDTGMAFIEEIIMELESTELDRHKIESIVETLKRDGELFEPRIGYCRKVSR
jgi:replicative DNA helicase Mcm